MFDVLVESTSQRHGARTWAFFAVSSVVWLLVFAAVAVAGIMTYDGRLDAEFKDLNLVAWAPPAPPPLPPAATHAVERVAPPTGMQSVTDVPTRIPDPHPAPPPVGVPGPGTVVGGDPNGQIDGELGNNGPGIAGVPIASVAHAAPPEPPVEPEVRVQTPPAPQRPVSRILTGIATRRVEPKYPDMAIKAGVSGSVVVEVTVSEKGEVISANVLSGPPLLRAAALEAARGWRFTPTLLGGTPVRVIGTITFAFKR